MTSGDPCVRPAGLHHAGVVVSDLAVSVPFYEQMFGAAEALRVETDWGCLVMMQFPNALVELLAYTEPGRADLRPTESDLGAAHIALEMDDVVAAQERLEARGVEFVGPPTHVTEGPSTGYVLTFCLDPDGNRIELIQVP